MLALVRIHHGASMSTQTLGPRDLRPIGFKVHICVYVYMYKYMYVLYGIWSDDILYIDRFLF